MDWADWFVVRILTFLQKMSSEGTKALADFLRNTGPPEMNKEKEMPPPPPEQLHQHTSNALKPLTFLNRLISPSKKKNAKQSTPLSNQSSNDHVQLLQHQPPYAQQGQRDDANGAVEGQKLNRRPSKRRTMGVMPSENQLINLTEIPQSSPDAEFPDSKGKFLNGFNSSYGYDDSSSDLLPTPPNHSPAQMQLLMQGNAKKMARLSMLNELASRDGNSDDMNGKKQSRGDKKSKYRKSKFPEQMMNGQDDFEENGKARKDDKKDFVFIDDELLQVIHQLGGNEEKKEGKVTSRREIPMNGSYADVEYKSNLPKKSSKMRLLVGEHLVRELGLKTSIIVRGGALRKPNYVSKSERVQFSGLDQIIPNEADAQTARMLPQQQRQHINPPRRYGSPAPEEFFMSSSGVKVASLPKIEVNKRKDEIINAPRVSSPLKNSLKNNDFFDAKDLPAAPVEQMAPSRPSGSGLLDSIPPPPPALDTAPYAPVFAVKPISINSVSMANAQTQSFSQEMMANYSRLESPQPVAKDVPQSLDSPSQDKPTGQKKRVKRRHIQIQTRRPEVHEVAVQVGASKSHIKPAATTVEASTMTDVVDDSKNQDNAFEEMTKELEKELDNLQSSNTNVTALQTELEETKTRLDALSEQAYKRIQVLLEDKQALMLEISELRSVLFENGLLSNEEYDEDLPSTDESENDYSPDA
jgi:hypothetical protein